MYSTYYMGQFIIMYTETMVNSKTMGGIVPLTNYYSDKGLSLGQYTSITVGLGGVF